MCMFSNMLYNGWCYEIEKSHCKEEILFTNLATFHITPQFNIPRRSDCRIYDLQNYVPYVKGNE